MSNDNLTKFVWLILLYYLKHFYLFKQQYLWFKAIHFLPILQILPFLKQQRYPLSQIHLVRVSLINTDTVHLPSHKIINASFCKQKRFSEILVYIVIHKAVNEPHNGQWSYWDSWSACTVSCGGGVRSRNRSCTEPPPQNGGDDCVGDSIQSKICNTFMCPGQHIIYIM